MKISEQGLLLIDVGNSALKYCFYADLARDRIISLNHGDYDIETLLNQLKSMGALRHISLANVYKAEVEIQISDWCKQNNLGFFLARSVTESLGLFNAYAEPDKLGVDRWLLMLSAWRYLKKDCFVISCGTATTFDAIDSQGRHLGGLIMPGLATTKEALSVGTEQIECIESSSSSSLELANNTAEAVTNAALVATIGFLQKGIEVSGMQTSPGIITGGWAESLMPYLPDNISYDKLAVMRGLALQAIGSDAQ